MSLFNDGTLRLKDPSFENEYLLWKQFNHMLVAVDRFNVASFWNTITGKLVFKTYLDNKNDQIKKAYMFRKHDSQDRYNDPTKHFDSLP